MDPVTHDILDAWLLMGHIRPTNPDLGGVKGPKEA